MKRLVLLRHGESTWNAENRFSGWTDVGLTDKAKMVKSGDGQVKHLPGLIMSALACQAFSKPEISCMLSVPQASPILTGDRQLR